MTHLKFLIHLSCLRMQLFYLHHIRGTAQMLVFGTSNNVFKYMCTLYIVKDSNIKLIIKLKLLRNHQSLTCFQHN